MKLSRVLSVGVAVMVAAGVVSTSSTTGAGASTIGANGSATSASASGALSCSDSMIEETLSNGASWRMCARIHPMKALVLEEIEYKPPTDREYSGYKRVLDQLALAQLNVPYDNGLVQYNDITSFGFGGEHLMSQTETTCAGDTIDIPQSSTVAGQLVTRTIPGICVDEVSTGLATHSFEGSPGDEHRFTERGTALEISSLSKISWYEYQQNITFDDHGGLDVGLGATGDVAPGGPGGTMFSTDESHGWPLGGPTTAEGEHTHATSHWHNAIWRVDFGIDEGERQFVEQWDYTNTAEAPLLPVLEGTGSRKLHAFHAVPGTNIDEETWFRVVNPDSTNSDGHARSYEIINQNHPHDEMEVFTPTLSFTNADPCQEYASQNLNADCPGQSILNYVADDEEELDDPVAWVNVGFHHIDRDEDQSPMHMHWQRFQLVPRDFFAQSPTIGDERSCINGAGWIDSIDSPCEATNLKAPTTQANGPLEPGTTLTAAPGTWNESRTAWEFTYVWLRDGEPIVGPDGAPQLDSDYTLTAADQGTDVSVRVSASHIGFPSGTADSGPVTVPPAASPARVRTKVIAHAKATRVGRRGVIVVHVKRLDTSAGATGKVRILRQGAVVGSGRLEGRKVRIRIKAFRSAGRHHVTVRFIGSTYLQPARARIKVRVR